MKAINHGLFYYYGPFAFSNGLLHFFDYLVMEHLDLSLLFFP